MIRRNSNETTGNDTLTGYPVRILGKFAVWPPEKVIVPTQAPTTEQLVQIACMAVTSSRRLNSYPGALITGRVATAAPTKSKNGSILLPMNDYGKMKLTEVMPKIGLGDPEIMSKTAGFGVYVTSDEKRAHITDINAMGVVVCDIEGKTLAESLLNREQLAVLPDETRQTFGVLLCDLATAAELSYGAKLHELAR